MNEEDARAYLELGISALEVVRLRWPGMSDEEAAHILWEHTPYPLISGILDIVEAVAWSSCDCKHPALDTGLAVW